MIRVLVVDDDPAVREITCKYVESVDGFAVVGRAHDGEDAKGAVKRVNPDLIVLDVYMPKKNGLDFLAELREEGCAAEVIFLTAADDAATMARAEQLGTLDYLVKPFNLERFRESLAKCAARACSGGGR